MLPPASIAAREIAPQICERTKNAGAAPRRATDARDSTAIEAGGGAPRRGPRIGCRAVVAIARAPAPPPPPRAVVRSSVADVRARVPPRAVCRDASREA
eukprot:30723-Pelagococcus_subviridis.AAC.21